MKAIITGANGTVGAVLCSYLRAQGHEVTAWDRNRIPIDDYYAMESFVQNQAPDVVYHLAIASQPTGRANESWLVNYQWPSELAWITRILSIPFVFTSTPMVFSNEAVGPFTRESPPNAKEGYGYEKRIAEERVFSQNPNARVVRLAWQIGNAAGNNNMIDYFARQMKELGEVRASNKWYPASAFLEDTAAALAKLPAKPPGLYMLDSNRSWTFYEIACALNEKHGHPWKVTATEDFVYDQRMLDDSLDMPPLSQRLPGLPAR